MRVLIIEQNRCAAEEVKIFLQQQKHIVDVTISTDNGIKLALANIYHSIIVCYDIGTAKIINVLREIRTGGIVTPIIVIGKNMSVKQMKECFNNGANDFLCKPFPMNLLELRLRVNTKSNPNVDISYYKIGDLEFYPQNNVTKKDESEAVLTRKESELLELLVINQNILLSKTYIIDRLWMNNYEFNDNNIEVHISNLRKKLRLLDSKLNIETVRNAGYCLRI